MSGPATPVASVTTTHGASGVRVAHESPYVDARIRESEIVESSIASRAPALRAFSAKQPTKPRGWRALRGSR